MKFTKNIIAFTLITAIFVNAFSGCAKSDSITQKIQPENPAANTTQTSAKKIKKTASPNPESAIKQIYSSLSERSGIIKPSSSEVLSLLSLAPQAVTETAVRYMDGDFGVSDVYIIKPASGEDDMGVPYKSIVTDALQERKDARMREFENYDVYSSTAISENALIFERGGYVILLILEDNDSARATIEKYIPEKLEIS